MKRNRACLCGLLAAMMLLSGCWNVNAIDNLDYVNAIGIDYLEDEKQFVVCLQLLSFEKAAKSEQGIKPDPTPAWLGIGKGKSYNEAIGKITVESQRRLFWGHVTALVLGDGFLNKGEISETLQTFFRFYELRYTMWVFGTKDKLTDIFTATPNFERSRLRMLLHTPKENFKQRSYIAPLRLNDFMAEYYEPVHTLALPSITIGTDIWHKNEEPIESLRYNGIYSFWQQKQTGFIPIEKIKGIRWMVPQTNRAPVSIVKDGKNVAGARMRKPRIAVKVAEAGGKPRFDVHVIVEGAITELDEGVPSKELIKQLQDAIEKEIRETYATGLKYQADLLGLGNRLYDKGADKYRQFADEKLFVLKPDSLRDVKVEVQLTTAGKYTYKQYNKDER